MTKLAYRNQLKKINMLLVSAIKKIEKVTGKEINVKKGTYTADFGKRVLEITCNGRFSLDAGIATILVRRKNDLSDSMTDYHAGSFYPNVKQAIEAAQRV